MASSEALDFKYMLSDTRARVYLLWAVLATGGFIATHFHQQRSINAAWLVIVLIGLGYMLKVMPMRIRKLRLIYLSWLLPLAIGLAVSVLVFQIDSWRVLIERLGGFWLLVMALGYFLNGLVDSPRLWYYVAVLLNLAAGLAVFMLDNLIPVQYLLAAVISGWSMLNLWIFRVD